MIRRLALNLYPEKLVVYIFAKCAHLDDLTPYTKYSLFEPQGRELSWTAFFFLADFDNSTWRSSDFCYDLFTRIVASWKNFFQFTNSRSRRLIRRCKMFEENFCGYFLAGKFSNRLWSWWYGGGKCCLRH